MTFGRGRARRPDDWPSSHVRARTALSDRLDGWLEPDEGGWLETHLAACPSCSSIADAYATQRLELRALREQTSAPPRDLWARTAAAIESEARFRDSRQRASGRRRLSLASFALLSTALAVAVIVGSLYSSRRPDDGGTVRPSQDVALATADVTAGGSPATVGPGATPLIVAQRVEWLTKDAGGAYRVQVANVDQVCPPESTTPCDVAAPDEHRVVRLDQNATTVFGSPDGEALIVVNEPNAASKGSVSVVTLSVDTTGGPSASPSPTAPLPSATASPTASAPGPTIQPNPTPSDDVSPPPSPSPSVSPSPSSEDGSVEIARDVTLVGQSAAYSASGQWFAFTARPADGLTGPDIYLWKVGDALAIAVTTDHRSVFGSWLGDTIVGSTVVETVQGGGQSATIELSPASFTLDPTTSSVIALPQTGRAWRPAVDPSGRQAVYWSGTIRATDGPGYAPDAGRLVLGLWGAGTTAPTDGPLPTSTGHDQQDARKETTIAAGRVADWDARWDAAGTHLAVWIADDLNPSVGRLSLYAVDAFDGRIDLKNPLLDASQATAGFAISDGQLVWAEPAADGSANAGAIQVLAWTEAGSGRVETVPGPVIVIR